MEFCAVIWICREPDQTLGVVRPNGPDARPICCPAKGEGKSVHQFSRLRRRNAGKECAMGRGLLLWLLGVPIPIILLIFLLYR